MLTLTLTLTLTVNSVALERPFRTQSSQTTLKPWHYTVSALYRIAIFCACLALTMGCEIVIFSPARRASRKLLERVVE